MPPSGTKPSPFSFLDVSKQRTDGVERRAQVAAAELANRAGLYFRLGYTQADATARLCARVAWEFESASTSSPDRRPESLSDQAVAKIVTDTYARRPG